MSRCIVRNNGKSLWLRQLVVLAATTLVVGADGFLYQSRGGGGSSSSSNGDRQLLYDHHSRTAGWMELNRGPSSLRDAATSAVITAGEWPPMSVVTAAALDRPAYSTQHKPSSQQHDPELLFSSTAASIRNAVNPSPSAAVIDARRFEVDTICQRYQRRAQQQFEVFCDLDGVLVDFEGGIRELFPELENMPVLSIDALPRPLMWHRVLRSGSFFERLGWAPGGQRLWQAIRHLQPDILTGCPAYVSSSQRQKFAWCRRELGIPVRHVDMAGTRGSHESKDGATPRTDSEVCNVITCWSYNKHYESGPGRILIDDNVALKDDWERKGGIFVHHVDVDSTLEQLRMYSLTP